MTTTPKADYSSRSLDALVAERVMGESCNCDGKTRNNPYKMPAFCSLHGTDKNGALKHYSTDIACAFQVVEKMRERGWSFACTMYAGKLPYASFCRNTAASSRNAEAESLPRATSLAALAALESVQRSER